MLANSQNGRTVCAAYQSFPSFYKAIISWSAQEVRPERIPGQCANHKITPHLGGCYRLREPFLEGLFRK